MDEDDIVQVYLEVELEDNNTEVESENKVKKDLSKFKSKYNYSKLTSSRPDIFVNDLQTYYLIFLIDEYLNGKFSPHRIFKQKVSIHNKKYMSNSRLLRNFTKIENFDKVFEIQGNTKVCNKFTELTYGYSLKKEIRSKILESEMFTQYREYRKNSFKMVKKYKGENGMIYDTVEQLAKGEGLTRYAIEKDLDKYACEIREIFSLYCYNSYVGDVKHIDYLHTVNINQESLAELIKAGLFAEEFGLTDFDWTQLIKLRDMVKSGRPIKIKYKRKGGGRLNNVFNLETPALQSITKEARGHLFKGQYIYDINTSAPSVIQGLCQKHYGYKMKKVQDYIENKEKYRQDLMNIGLTYKESKQFFTALFFGAGLKDNMYTIGSSTFHKLFGVQKVREILEHSKIVTDLYIELSQFIKKFGKYLRDEKVVKGKDGKMYLHNSRSSTKLVDLNKWSNSKALVFYYFGIESQILDILIRNYDHNLLLYDAFISDRRYDLNEMSELVKSKMGLDITFSREEIKILPYNKDEDESLNAVRELKGEII